MPRHAAPCRDPFTDAPASASVQRGEKSVFQTHNAGVAGSSPAPAIPEVAQSQEVSGSHPLRSPNSATTGATKRTKKAPQGPVLPVLCDGTGFAPECIVYGLIDPRCPTIVRYVGKTTAYAARYAQHIGTSGHGRDRTAWVFELRDAGRLPWMVLLERVVDESALDDRELHWIATLKAHGQADLNQPVPRWYLEGKPRPPQPWWVRQKEEKPADSPAYLPPCGQDQPGRPSNYALAGVR